MFDASAEIELGFRLASGAESVTVRWPTDQEWAARARSRKFIVRRLGRGVSETVPPAPNEADVQFYEKIALNGTPAVTKGEARQIIDVLATAAVTNVTVEGNEASIDLNVLTGAVKHRVKLPTADQVIGMRAAAFRMLDLPFSQQQIQILLEPAARLWDECHGSSEDYANGVVPALHKDVAMRSLIEYLDNKLGLRRDDESF
jgi:hypothetical protein